MGSAPSHQHGAHAKVRPPGRSRTPSVEIWERPGDALSIMSSMSESDSYLDGKKNRSQEKLKELLNDPDLSSESWRNEEGQYKSQLMHVVGGLNGILGFSAISPSVQETNEAKREITKAMVDAKLIPKLCRTIVDVFRDSEPSEADTLLAEECKLLILNATDCSEPVAKLVTSETDLLDFFFKTLETCSEKHLSGELDRKQETLVYDGLTISHNCAMYEVNLARFRELNVVPALEPYLKSPKEEYKLVTLAVLSSVIDEEQSDIIERNTTTIKFLVEILGASLTNKYHKCMGFSSQESGLIIKQLARNDANKKLLMSFGALEPLVAMAKSDLTEEKYEAVSAIRFLSFDVENKQLLVDSEEGVVDLMVTLREHTDSKVKQEAEGTLWNLRSLLANIPKYKELVHSLLGTQEEAHDAKPSQGHVMISYRSTQREQVRKICHEIKDKGFTVWIDYEQMSGNTLDAMDEAVSEAQIVLLCASQGYKNSANCRAEAECAFDQRKMIIPLIMETGYRPDGWLRMIFGAKLFYDFSGKYPFRSKMDGLLREIAKCYQPTKASVPVVEVDGPPVTYATHGSTPHNSSQLVAGSDRTVAMVKQWSSEDVRNWANKNELPADKLQDVRGKDIALLYAMLHEAPESFYRSLRKWLKIDNLSDTSSFVWALRELE